MRKTIAAIALFGSGLLAMGACEPWPEAPPTGSSPGPARVTIVPNDAGAPQDGGYDDGGTRDGGLTPCNPNASPDTCPATSDCACLPGSGGCWCFEGNPGDLCTVQNGNCKLPTFCRAGDAQLYGKCGTGGSPGDVCRFDLPCSVGLSCTLSCDWGTCCQ